MHADTTLPHTDPDAERLRRDLRRVHRVLGSATILRRAIDRLGLGAPPRRILDLGAGDGTLLLRVARGAASTTCASPCCSCTASTARRVRCCCRRSRGARWPSWPASHGAARSPAPGAWALDEYPAGLFLHCFAAVRVAARYAERRHGR